MSFIATRCLSGMAVLTFPNAKKDGMLHTFSKTGEKAKKAVLIFLAIELLIVYGIGVYVNTVFGVAIIVATGFSVVCYRCRMIKEFGGITGDTAGYFVATTETICAVVLAVIGRNWI